MLLLLGLTGFAAGFVDAIAGGGGLITIPVLVSVGLPPVAAFATNKLQSVIGTLIAATTYWRGGFLDLKAALAPMLVGFFGGLTGAFAVKQVDTGLLEHAVPIALLAIALYFTLAPRLTDADRRARLDAAVFVPVMAALVGFYDGLFGPGTGSFLTMGFVALFGFGVTRAAGYTKAINLMSNAGALALFLPAGDVIAPVAAVMIVGQVAGGWLGAHTGIRFGAKLIRPMVVVVSVVLALRLLLLR
ncbi:MAG TPA: TSUP family transporter [Alphaproteobacteria bacterium]|nr:TSUP family transporter [Alphaproteobacteria bacterium]